jgi:uncharacterized membrane protein YeaQ/YmgE (transglycosylase-associated protein family)
MNSNLSHFTSKVHKLAAATLATVVLTTLIWGNLSARAADSVTEKVTTATAEAEKKVQEASKTAQSHWEELWRRIDEQRLKNRTPDQIVAWIIMGLLVSSLIHEFSKLNRFATLLLGLAGSFIGGMIANISGLNLGLGPVLIRYEDLIASLAGGLLLLLAARWISSRRTKAK